MGFGAGWLLINVESGEEGNFSQELSGTEGIDWVYVVSGEFDLIAGIEGEDDEAVVAIGNLISTFKGFESSELLIPVDRFPYKRKQISEGSGPDVGVGPP